MHMMKAVAFKGKDGIAIRAGGAQERMGRGCRRPSRRRGRAAIDNTRRAGLTAPLSRRERSSDDPCVAHRRVVPSR